MASVPGVASSVRSAKLVDRFDRSCKIMATRTVEEKFAIRQESPSSFEQQANELVWACNKKRWEFF